MNPSLALIPSAFNTGKLYSVLPEDGTGDFTVSRNGNATFFDKDGILRTALPNEPRFDFDPLTGEFKGILVEPAATNLFLRSEEFDNVYWAFVETPQANAGIAPNGQLTADLYTPVFSNISIAVRTINLSGSLSGTSYTVSFYIRSNTGTNFTSAVEIIPTSGDIVRTTPQVNGYTITPKWTRITHTFVLTSATNGSGNVSIRLFRDFNALGKNFFIWGAQLEVGPVATSYIPTVASTVTRPADVISRTNAQDLIGQTEGTIFCSYFLERLNKNVLVSRIIGVTQNNNNNRVEIIQADNNAIITRISKNGVEQASFSSFNTVNLGINKVALSYSSNGAKLYINGNLVASNISLDVPYTDRINIGDSVLGGNSLNDCIKSAYVFKRALNDAQAIALTTL